MVNPIIRGAVLALALLPGIAGAKPLDQMFPADRLGALGPTTREFLGRFDYQQGTVRIGTGYAEAEVGGDFYFLGSFDARSVLEDVWGNPPDDTVLGMIFPARYLPVDQESWGIAITYEPMGHVSDADAASYDYTEMLADMKASVRDENDWRRDNGYGTIELVGWAAEPRYDTANHKLYWAEELFFEGAPGNTLNYNIRVLGRKGVLNLNFIADMSALPEIEAAMPAVLEMVAFTPGNRHEEFDPATDQVAEASIGSLISGGGMAEAGLAIAALVLLKKFWFVLLLPLIWLKNLFTGRRNS